MKVAPTGDPHAATNLRLLRDSLPISWSVTTKVAGSPIEKSKRNRECAQNNIRGERTVLRKKADENPPEQKQHQKYRQRSCCEKQYPSYTPTIRPTNQLRRYDEMRFGVHNKRSAFNDANLSVSMD
ncbi:hypothetical protein GYB43_11440 [bacterium]|nr:hypothetical protein [bacterium]